MSRISILIWSLGVEKRYLSVHSLCGEPKCLLSTCLDGKLTLFISRWGMIFEKGVELPYTVFFDVLSQLGMNVSVMEITSF